MSKTFWSKSLSGNNLKSAIRNRKPVLSQVEVFAIMLGVLLFALSFPVWAQEPQKIPRIGFLDASTASGMAVLVDAFRGELSKLGWQIPAAGYLLPEGVCR